MPKRILIVDDDPEHRLILRTMLEAKGYGCMEAEDGGAALSILEGDHVDLVLTDLDMPRMNGLKLIDQMGRASLLERTSVIIITSQSLEDMPIGTDKTGAKAVISKPYDLSKLLEEVERVIGQSKKECHSPKS